MALSSCVAGCNGPEPVFSPVVRGPEPEPPSFELPGPLPQPSVDVGSQLDAGVGSPMSGSPSGGGAPSAPAPSDAGASELECGEGRIAAGGECFCVDGPFGAPEPVVGLAVTGSAFGPSLSSDGLTLYFSVIDGVGDDGPPGPNENDEDIFRATRATRSAQFEAAVVVPGLDAGDTEEGTPFISFDGLSLWFFSTRPEPEAPGDRDLWVATRPTVTDEFDAPSLVEGVNSPALEHLPWLSPDGTELLFVSDRPALAAGSNIWSARRDGASGAFDEPIELAVINSDARDEGFALSADGLTLVLSSNRAGSADMDLWLARRSSTDEPFSEPENLSAVNSAAADVDAMLSSDGLELFFSSQRDGTHQLFRAVRQCE